MDNTHVSAHNQSDAGCTTVIGYALWISRDLCPCPDLDVAYGNFEARLCPCIEPLKILLRSGCPLTPARDFHGKSWNAIGRASVHARLELVLDLRERREELRALASERLSSLDLKKLNLGPGVLDITAEKVEAMLESRGTDVPTRLRVRWHPEEEGVAPIGRYRSSVYYNITLTEVASTFFDLGFRDTDETVPETWEEDLCQDDFPFDSACTQNPNAIYLKWLLDHGLQLRWWWMYVPPVWQRRASNGFVAAGVLGSAFFAHPLHLVDTKLPMPDTYWDQQMRAARYLHNELIISSAEKDTCECACSEDGCTPLLRMLGSTQLPTGEIWGRNSESNQETFKKYMKGYGLCLGQRQYLAALRFITFDALQLRHTCREERNENWWLSGSSDGSASEYGDHEHDSIGKLEILLEEFGEQLFAPRPKRNQSCAFADTDDGLNSPETTSTLGESHDWSECSKVITKAENDAFWDGYWPQRVREANRAAESHRPWSQDKAAAAQLGVIWDDSSENDDACSLSESIHTHEKVTSADSREESRGCGVDSTTLQSQEMENSAAIFSSVDHSFSVSRLVESARKRIDLVIQEAEVDIKS